MANAPEVVWENLATNAVSDTYVAVTGVVQIQVSGTRDGEAIRLEASNDPDKQGFTEVTIGGANLSENGINRVHMLNGTHFRFHLSTFGANTERTLTFLMDAATA